jgi:hypothetical protein
MIHEQDVMVWITKYALTKGIFCKEAEIKGDMIKYDRYSCELKPDWHLTQEEAIKRAEEMREKKIKSLKKSLAKMEGLEFKTQQEK